jgi:hypothetical protein
LEEERVAGRGSSGAGRTLADPELGLLLEVAVKEAHRVLQPLVGGEWVVWWSGECSAAARGTDVEYPARADLLCLPPSKQLNLVTALVPSDTACLFMERDLC